MVNDWKTALGVCGVCVDNQGANIPGCLGAHGGEVATPAVEIMDGGGPSPSEFREVVEGRTRIVVAKMPGGLGQIGKSIKESKHFCGAILSLFPDQTMIHPPEFRPFHELLKESHQAYLDQTSSTWDPNSSILGVAPLMSTQKLLPLQVRRSPTKFFGASGYYELCDSRVGITYKCSSRLSVIIASSFTIPSSYDKVQEWMKEFTIGNIKAFDTEKLLGDVTTKRVKDVKDQVDKSRGTNTPLLIVLPDELVQVMGDFLIDDCMLEKVQWCEFCVFFSPVIGHMLAEVAIADNVLTFDFDTERLRNASGVLCCIKEVGNSRRYGLGAPLNSQDKTFRHSTRNLEYLHNYGGGYAQLALPETGVTVKLPVEHAETVAALDAMVDNGGKVSFDMEYNKNSKNLGTLAFCYLPQNEAGDEVQGEVVLILIRKQVVGDEVFDQEVRPRLIRMLRGETNMMLITFDFRNDKAALVRNGIIDENSTLHGVIDLRDQQRVGACFRFMYQVDSKTNRLETQLGLANFVWMTATRDLDKGKRDAAWDSEEVQNDDKQINYAIVDAYAIHCVVKYCEGAMGVDLFEVNGQGGAVP